jgi:serine/threonine protein kinase
MVDSFKTEAKLMSKLRHPNVVLFMAASTTLPKLAIVTEFMTRGTLYDVLHSDILCFAWSSKLSFAYDAARGMNYLHSSKPSFLHRDLKSLNLLVDDKWNVKVSDFGLTTFKDLQKDNKEDTGSLLWMAPEVLRGEGYTKSSDVYSFGIILWELLTQLDPYPGKSPANIMAGVMNDDLRPEIPSSTTTPIRELIESCWHSDPTQRPTFSQILENLNEQMRNTSSSSTNYDERGSSFTIAETAPSEKDVTIVFTDVENSTSLWEETPRGMQQALALHNKLMRKLLKANNGYEVKTEGDSFMVAFTSAIHALNWCVDVQKALIEVDWPEEILSCSFAETVK